MGRGTSIGLIAAAAAFFLLPGAASASAPGKIAFISDRGGADNEIFLMNADGSGQTPLTDNGFNEQDPAWSPNGKQIAFLSDRDGGADEDLWVMNADGSGARQLTFNTLEEYSIDWAPNGRRLVFSQENPPGDDLFLINADGTGLTQLTFTDFFYIGAHFSPDGQWIAFNKDVAMGSDVLGLIRPDGSGLTGITSIEAIAPDFTGDGKRIVFYSSEAPDGGTDPEIMSVATNGSDLRQLTSNSGPGSADSAPSPSRDGRNRIAFRSNRDGDNEIFVMNADGSGQTQLTLTDATSNDRGPDWQPTAKCQGKVATIVGTAASETLTGGPAADIISGQGGKDQIKGLGGKDIVCGDAGNDTLNGGKGKDTLNGGKGRDKTVGGKGKDRCIGGKGKDTAKACEKLKKIP